MVVPHGTTRIFHTGAAELPRGWARIFRAGGHESSVRAGADLPRRRARIFCAIRFENGGNQKANVMRNNAKGSRNAARIVRNIIIGIELANCSARNLLIVRAESSKCPRGIR